MIQRDGWNLLFHECLVEQLRKLHAAAERAQKQDPKGSESNANVRLFAALSKLIFEIVPSDPNREEYRQGNTMGAAYRHWRRAKIGRRFRLFFRFDSKTRIIIFAWVNDEHTLRASGASSVLACRQRDVVSLSVPRSRSTIGKKRTFNGGATSVLIFQRPSKAVSS